MSSISYHVCATMLCAIIFFNYFILLEYGGRYFTMMALVIFQIVCCIRATFFMYLFYSNLIFKIAQGF